MTGASHAGSCVLLVEDEIMVSMMLQDRLERAGYRVLTAATLDAALTLAAHGQVDVAVLDINLDGQPSFPVAEVLRQRGIPFTFSSGYGVEGLPPSYRSESMLQKPYATEALLNALDRLLGAGTVATE